MGKNAGLSHPFCWFSYNICHINSFCHPEEPEWGEHWFACMRNVKWCLSWSGAKTIKKNTNSTQNKSETHRAKQYEVTSFLSTDCELSTETCSKNVYSLGPRFVLIATIAGASKCVLNSPAHKMTSWYGKVSCFSAISFLKIKPNSSMLNGSQVGIVVKMRNNTIICISSFVCTAHWPI